MSYALSSDRGLVPISFIPYLPVPSLAVPLASNFSSNLCLSFSSCSSSAIVCSFDCMVSLLACILRSRSARVSASSFLGCAKGIWVWREVLSAWGFWWSRHRLVQPHGFLLFAGNSGSSPGGPMEWHQLGWPAQQGLLWSSISLAFPIIMYRLLLYNRRGGEGSGW